MIRFFLIAIFHLLSVHLPASWMKEQINRDLAPYRHQVISIPSMRKHFTSPPYPYYFVEFTIKKNRVYAYPTSELKGSFLYGWHKSFYKAIKELAKEKTLPDVTFFVCMIDCYHADMEYPLFVFETKQSIQGQILVPDPFNLRGDYNVAEVVKKAPRWKEKESLLVWRGSTGQYLLENGITGREILCHLSLEHPSLIDAGYTFSYTAEDPHQQIMLQKYGKERLSYERLIRSKYLLWIDGFNASFSDSGWRLFSGSLIFKPQSEHIQWYYQALQPGVHFLSTKADLSDLVEKIKWAKTHDKEAKHIAKNARSFALQSITREGSKEYLYHLLWEYSRLNFAGR